MLVFADWFAAKSKIMRKPSETTGNHPETTLKDGGNHPGNHLGNTNGNDVNVAFCASSKLRAAAMLEEGRARAPMQAS